MTIARLSGQDTKAAGTSGTVTATYPSVPTEGNLLIATVWKGGGTDPAPSGWSTDDADNAGNNASIRMLIFFKVAGASEPQAFSIAVGSNPSRIHLYEYSGTHPDIAQVWRANNKGNSGASTVTSQTTNAVTAVNGDLLFATAGTATAYTGTGAWTNSFSLLQEDAGLRMFDGERIITADGSYSSTGSWTTTNKATAFISAFKPIPPSGFEGWGVPL